MNNKTQLATRDYGQYITEPQSKDSRTMIPLMFNTLRLWWPEAILLGPLAAAAAAAAVFFTFQPEYKASIWLRIYTDAPYIVFQEKGESDQFVANQTQLIRSRLVLGSLMSDPVIANLDELSDSVDKIEELASRIVVRPVGKSEYFAVEYRGNAERASEQVVQRVVNSYMLLQNGDEARQLTDVMTLLEEEKTTRQQKVEELRKSLAQMVEDSTVVEGTKSPFAEERMSNLEELRKRMVTLDVESAILKIEIKAFENSRDQQKFSPSTNQIDISVENHPEMRAAHRVLEKLKDQLRANNRVGSRHPTYKRVYDEFENQKRRIVQLREKLTRLQVDNSRITWDSERDNQLEEMKSRLASYNITREVIESHIAADIGSIKKNNGDSFQVEFLQSDLNQATEVHNLISRRLLTLKTEQRAPARVQPLDSGQLKAIPVETMRLKKMTVAGGGAFTIPFLLLFGWEFWLRRVSNTSQLANAGELDVIGEIANLPPTKMIRYSQGKKLATQKHLYYESVDQLRTFLVCQESQRNAQVITVTSAVSGEGKTSLALQLAASLAAATDKRVLLIDGDLRYPGAHQKFEAELSPGLGEVLKKTDSWESVVQRSKASGPYVLTAGELLASPHRLFGGNEFKHLLVQLRRHFRYIVIDSPPLLSASESLVMAKAADVVLFCVRRDRSRLDYVRSAHDRLLLAGVHSVGTVLTGVPFRSYTSKYGVYGYPEKPRAVVPTIGCITSVEQESVDQEIDESDNSIV